MNFIFELNDEKDGMIIFGVNSGNYYKIEEITIPSTLQNKPVTHLSERSFTGFTSLKKINIPETIKNIYPLSFLNCPNLVEINVNPKNPYLSSEKGILFNKKRTVIIVYPQGKAESKYETPDTVIEIGSRAFLNSRNLKNIVIPKSIKTINNYAFSGTNFEALFLHEKIEYIGEDVFSNHLQTKLCSIFTPLSAKPNKWHKDWNKVNLKVNWSHKGKIDIKSQINVANLSTNVEQKEKKIKLIVYRKYDYEIIVPEDTNIPLRRINGKNYNAFLKDLGQKIIKPSPTLISDSDSEIIYATMVEDKLSQGIVESNEVLIGEFRRIWNEFPHENFGQTLNELLRTIHNHKTPEDYEDYLPQNYRKKYFKQVGTKKSPDYDPIESLEEDRRDVEYQAIRNWIFDMGNEELLGWLKKVVEFIGL